MGLAKKNSFHLVDTATVMTSAHGRAQITSCHKRAVVEDKAGAPLQGECSEQ
jgi:hypothetical protein